MFLDWCDAQIITSILQLNPQLLRQYLVYLEGRGHNQGRIHTACRTLKAFLALVGKGLCLPEPSLRYCLVTGKIATERDREQLHELFEEKDWLLLDEQWIKSRLEQFAERGYEDDEAIIVAKLFSRIETRKQE